MTTSDNPWTVLSTDRVYDDQWLALDKHRVVNAAGIESRYGVVHYKKLGVRILPIDQEGRTILVGQYRFGAGYYSWELPAGGCEHHQPPLEGARRELREEAGLEAEHWLQVLDLVPSGSLTDEREIVFLAWGLTACARDPDPQEVIRAARVPFETVLQRVMRGEIRDAGTVAVVFAVDALLRRGELPDEVARALFREGVR